MPVAIETVIIIIVVVSFAVLSAVILALYWMWRLLLEDRRCNRLGSSSFHREWQCPASLRPLEEGPQRALLGSRRNRHPQISRRQEVFVDERSRRMVKVTRCTECPTVRSITSTAITNLMPENIAPPSVQRMEEITPPEVVVLDGTEPPPPYEAITR